MAWKAPAPYFGIWGFSTLAFEVSVGEDRFKEFPLYYNGNEFVHLTPLLLLFLILVAITCIPTDLYARNAGRLSLPPRLVFISKPAAVNTPFLYVGHHLIFAVRFLVKFCNMKAIDIFCASPASTAICLSLEQRSLVRQGSQTRLLERQGSRAFEPSDILPDQSRRERPRKSTERRRSNADQSARAIEPSPQGIEQKPRRSTHRRSSNSLSRFSCSAIDQSAIVPYQPPPAPKPVKKSPVVIKDRSASSSSSTDATEVVVLRVSLHCQGCAGKVKKHISKMEGVTSFSIDLPKQKVTVEGNLTPLEVLESISRVKNAELWPSSRSNNWSKTITVVCSCYPIIANKGKHCKNTSPSSTIAYR